MNIDYKEKTIKKTIKLKTNRQNCEWQQQKQQQRAFISWNVHCCNNTLKLKPRRFTKFYGFSSILITSVGFVVALRCLICAHFGVCHRHCRLSEYKLIVPKCKIGPVCVCVCVHLFHVLFFGWTGSFSRCRRRRHCCAKCLGVVKPTAKQKDLLCQPTPPHTHEIGIHKKCVDFFRLRPLHHFSSIWIIVLFWRTVQK